MKFLLSAAALAFCLVPASRAADEVNPFLKAKVGDYVEYKGTMLTMGKTVEITKRIAVIAKNDKVATIEETVKGSVMGKDIPTQTQRQKIDLTKPFDQTGLNNLPKGTEIKIEKGQATEKIKAAGKEYECTWIKAKTTFKLGDLTTDSDIKVWTSNDVPVSGMVKMEAKSQAITITMELAGFGHK